MSSSERRWREAGWRLAGAGLPALRSGERVLLSFGGWISGGDAGGSGRVVLTNARLLNIRQDVMPGWPRWPDSDRILSVDIADIAEVGPVDASARRGWRRFRPRLCLTLKLATGRELTVVSAGVPHLSRELRSLKLNSEGGGPRA